MLGGQALEFCWDDLTGIIITELPKLKDKGSQVESSEESSEGNLFCICVTTFIAFPSRSQLDASSLSATSSQQNVLMHSRLTAVKLELEMRAGGLGNGVGVGCGVVVVVIGVEGGGVSDYYESLASPLSFVTVLKHINLIVVQNVKMRKNISISDNYIYIYLSLYIRCLIIRWHEVSKSQDW